MYIKIETARLDYLRKNQSRIRSDLYQGVLDSVAIGESRASQIGRKIILPASFIGGPRDMRRRYVDAMALVQKYGKPDIFLTMTCNPSWPEIKEHLGSTEEAQNRPDLVARVFRSKVEELKIDLFKREIFGSVSAYMYVIEFQKRGLPHAHFLVILKRSAKILSADQFDSIVSAEIPIENSGCSHLRSTVIKHMIHGPCGDLNPNNVCMKKNGKCKSHYPREFCNETAQEQNSYPLYRRRDDKQKVNVRGHQLNNRWVIPYNPFLLAKFDCHMNVEICSTIKAVKYLYKYIYKGHDRVSFHVSSEESNNEIDEIYRFQSGRWIGPAEAMWRIYGFVMNEIYPPVINLQLHIEDHQIIHFQESADLNYVARNTYLSKTMLTEFFAMNYYHDECKQYLYKEFPAHFVWNKKDRKWTFRKKGYALGRIITANPMEGERYYLRMLLNHVRGPISFDDLKWVNGVHALTFREAALLHGLLEDDNSLEQCMDEASVYHMPSTFRQLFATIMVFCNPKNPKYLCTKFFPFMSEDFAIIPEISTHDIKCRTLLSIQSLLESMSKSLNDYDLIDDDTDLVLQQRSTREIEDERSIPIKEEDLLAKQMLNWEQKVAYESILDRVFKKLPGAFFVDGPGGTGKTFLYRALLATVRKKGLIALATATSGIAASILPGGRTAHSRFKIPIEVDENDEMVCTVSKQSSLAQLFRLASLIIWDEASMAKKQAIESLDKMLQDVMDCKSLFGGKVIVFGGDFRQILPVLPKSSREQAIEISFVRSSLWPELEVFKLTKNIRAQFDPSFCQFLLRVGEGKEPIVLRKKIQIPSNILIKNLDDVSSVQELIKFVFPNIEAFISNHKSMINRAILTPKNESVDELNNMLIQNFPGEEQKYFSFDETIDFSDQSLQEDFLHNLTPSGFPPHELILKANCPIILLRNIDPPNGLSNGTRLICRRFERNLIDAEIVIGQHQGNRVFIPRIPLLPPKNESFPFPFKRTQFPIRLSFCMTINKAQGQTLDCVGLYLPQPVFSHGQLYVALSRVTNAKHIKVLLKPTSSDDIDSCCTENVVYEEILRLADEDY